MTSVESHPASGSECDAINEKPGLTHTVSAGGISLSPELFEKVQSLMLDVGMNK